MNDRKLTEYNTDLPDWLLRNINKVCPYCGANICDSGPFDNYGNMTYTQRFCINPKCPGHMSHKIDILAKRFNIKNFGPETALSLCRLNHYDNHLEALKFWFPEEKPYVHLWEVADMAMLYGYSGSWRDMLLGCKDFEEFFATKTNLPPVISANKDYLIYCQSFFRIKPPLSVNVINVMMTGSINGYSNRAQFIAAINETFGKYVQVIDVGKRVRGVSFLIKEEGTVDHSKSALAMSSGIPIVTPITFLQYVANKVKEVIECE